MKAMILAAGRGERLRPLTDTVPKPLIEIAGKPLIQYHIENLAKAGVLDIVINVAYLGPLIEAYCGNGERFGVRIEYSREYAFSEPLETGGGIIHALPLLGDEPFFVLSADVYAPFPYASLLQKPLNTLAHLLLVENPAYHPEGDYYLENGYLSQSGSQRFTYANLGIFSTKILENCPPGMVRLASIIEPFISTSTISAEVYKGPWFNVGTLQERNHCEHYVNTVQA